MLSMYLHASERPVRYPFYAVPCSPFFAAHCNCSPAKIITLYPSHRAFQTACAPCCHPIVICSAVSSCIARHAIHLNGAVKPTTVQPGTARGTHTRTRVRRRVHARACMVDTDGKDAEKKQVTEAATRLQALQNVH